MNANVDFFAGLRTMTKLFLLCIAAWVAGLLAYLGALGILYHQSISGGDFRAVVFWSIVAYFICLMAVYFPILLWLRRTLHGTRPLWPFPVVGVLLGVVPTAIVGFFNGGRLRDLFSPEAFLFYAMFSAVGLILGIGIPRLWRGH